VVWVDETTGNADILFKRSRDGGASFSNTPINLRVRLNLLIS
jgi:hypothetical protein